MENQSQDIQKQTQIKKVKDFDDLKARLLTLGFYGGVGYAGYRFLLKPMLQKSQRSHETTNLMTNTDKQQATVLYNAMNPSGVSWMRNMDKTNEEEIFNAARKIKDWPQVQKSYNSLYNRDLLSDLQSELDTEEYYSFLRILGESTSSSSSSGQTSSSKGLIVASTKDVRLRSTPDSSVSAYSFNTNILSTIKANKFLGWTTGKKVVDNKGVKYYEVAIRFSGDIPRGTFTIISRKQDSKTLRFWVGAGAIALHRHYKQLFDSGVKLYQGVKDMNLRHNFK